MRNFLWAAIAASVTVSAHADFDTKAARFGNWTVYRSTDAMTDKTVCTGIYKDDFKVQLAPEMLAVKVPGGVQTVTMRFGEDPALPFRYADSVEKELSIVRIDHRDFDTLLGANRLRAQVSTLFNGVVPLDFDLSGIQQAIQSIRNGCPGGFSPPAAKAASQADPSACSPTVLARLRSSGMKKAQIDSVCQP